ncbi:hypothetical protein F5884DRAFT_817951 [Xylogone sp. PMI_703]|nr:hypothetical protein F5884DRAFT_817951 [Xylogone sp. PMI_703]
MSPEPGFLGYEASPGLQAGTSDNDLSDASDETEMVNLPDFSDRDAESLIGLAISRAATRLTLPNTPAEEKAAAMMEDFDGAGFSDSDPETSPMRDSVITTGQRSEGLSLDKLPSPTPVQAEIPTAANTASRTAYQIGPRSPVIHPVSGISYQSSLHGVLEPLRRRALSGSTDALKRFLPKNLPSITSLPSIAQVGNFFSTGPSTPNSSPKLLHGGSAAVQGYSDSSGSSTPKNYTNRLQKRSPTRKGSSMETQRPAMLRRTTSDDSLLYHSLSKASSLGDDTRFEHQREQVNSRVKAIRDSLQDRSSFRMPQMPQIPSMQHLSRTFTFPKNFFNSSSGHVRSRSDTNIIPDILPGQVKKKKFPDASSHLVTSGIVGAATSAPEVVMESTKPLEGPNPRFLDQAMENLTGDVVIMGGYRGSILRSAKPPHRQLWVPVKVGLNLRKVDLEVGLEPEDEEKMEETIFASGMLQNIGPVDISKRLFKRLSECENAKNGKLRIWDYGYDWRLSPHLLSRKLAEFLANLPCNQGQSGPKGALVIAHSLGGLITRHVVNSRPELFSGVIYAGVPKSCVNILGPFRNGDPVLLSSRVLTAQVNFTLRTSFLLLPEDGRCFIDINTKEAYPVDFFNPDDWIKYRWSPCTDPPLPPRNPPTLRILNRPVSLGLPNPVKRLSWNTQLTSSGATQTNESSHGRARSQSSILPRAEDVAHELEPTRDKALAPQMDSQNKNLIGKFQGTNTSVATTVTIPRDKAITYLHRTLAETKKFKEELHFKPELSESNRYPPVALIYNKSIPTVYGAKVDGREGIPCADSYDNLAFASGDGVVLAREAMLPEGYKAVYGGRIRSDRGHGRAKGIGSGVVHNVHMNGVLLETESQSIPA